MSDEGDSSPRILIVEDECLVALDEEALVRSLGFEVLGPVGHLEEALHIVATERIDGAVLDIHLDGNTTSYPLAAELEIRRAANEAERLGIVVRREVADAARRFDRAKALLAVFEGGGMIDRAENALRVAEKSYKAGAISLIELLEAQRTFLETRAEYVRAQHDFRQARVDLRHAVGSNFQ